MTDTFDRTQLDGKDRGQLSEIAGAALEGELLINTVRDLETRLLGVPAGIQDYYPPVYGGLAALHLEPGAPTHHNIALPIHDLADRFLLHYTGIAHFSGTNNWEMYKRQIEKKKKVTHGFEQIAETAIEMERALETANFEAAGRALAREWENRKALIDGISTPEIDAVDQRTTPLLAAHRDAIFLDRDLYAVGLHPRHRRPGQPADCFRRIE